ncbi:hypothetical protein [Succinimonas sp.]|uniref:hypothetical protein n=1 Tax=Succinimonas sp. TaxID=1936151 RepID=UPI00386B5C6E
MAETDDPGESGFIYTFSDIAKNLQIDKRTFKNWKWDLVKKKQGREYLFEKESLYKAISDNSYTYIKDIKSPCKYDKLTEYLTIEQCAEMLGLKDARQFRRNYIDYDPGKLPGVGILKIGSTVRIEKESFEFFLKWVKDVDNRVMPQYLSFKHCAEMLGITTRQFKRIYVDKKMKGQGVKFIKIGSIIRIEKESFLSYLKKAGIKYKIPEYLTIEQCAEMLGIAAWEFKKNYISNKKLKSEGVKIKKSIRFIDGVNIRKFVRIVDGITTVNYVKTTEIEKESFFRYLEKSGGEKAK